MKLSFLGQSYEASTSTIDPVETDETLTFLGKRYNRKQYNVSQRQHLPIELTFLGRHYIR